MRYINTTGYNPKSWKLESQVKQRALKACPTIDDKKAFLNTGANQTWTRLKPSFEKLSHKKCWFTEAYATVSDFQIEHFRPKKKIDLIKSKDTYPEKRTVADTNGYWWLSYELENFRLAGGKPNQLKGNYFPLENTSPIANPNDNSWRKEVPMLLDPCMETDVNLLTYNGVEPIEANPDDTTADHQRARISIKVYGLKHDKLKNARSRVYEEAKNYYKTCERNWNAMQANQAVNVAVYNLAKENFDDNCANLVLILKPNKQFTRMVLAFLIGANKSWVRDYILRIAEQRKYI